MLLFFTIDFLGTCSSVQLEIAGKNTMVIRSNEDLMSLPGLQLDKTVTAYEHTDIKNYLTCFQKEKPYQCY